MGLIPSFLKGKTYYTKEGPGVAKNGPQKKKFILFFEQFFANFGKLIISGLFTTAFTLPIVTLGLGSVGITNISRNIYCGRHSFGVSDYMETIKKNWKQALVVGLINTIVMALLAWDIHYFGTIVKDNNDTFSSVALGMCIFIFATFAMMKYYVWVLMITFKYTIKKIYKNSFKFVFLNFPKSLFVGICSIVAYGLAFLLFWYGGSFGLAIVVALAFTVWPPLKALLIQYCVFDSIKKIIIDPYYNEHPDEDIELRKSMGFLSDDEEEPVFEDAE